MSGSRPKRHALAIELTSYCNQKCGYCYNAWRADDGRSTGALSSATLIALIDRVLTDVEFDHVTLTGGEPFARADFFELLDAIARHETRVAIISNGGLITDAIAKRLAAHAPLFVQVTLDGNTRELHEAHVGPGHYDATLRGMEALTAHGVPLAGCIVVTRKNAAVVGEILAQFRAHGAGQIAFSRFSPAGYAAEQIGELLPSRSELLVALAQAEQAAAEHGTDIQITMPIPPCVIDEAEYPHLRFARCPIGTEMQELALGPTGELRNCTLHSEVIGDLRSTPLPVLLDAPAIAHYRDVTPEFCAPCSHRASCIGGCGAAAQAVFGTRGLDPIVAQHVDPEFRRSLKQKRSIPVVA